MENNQTQTTEVTTDKTIDEVITGATESAEKIIADQTKLQDELKTAQEQADAKVKLDETLDKTNDTLDDVEKNLEKREQELLEREIKAEFKDKGLEKFADIVTITDAKQLPAMVKKLEALMNDLKISMSYQPVDNTKQDAYTIAEQKKDTKSMIGNKLSNLFK